MLNTFKTRGFTLVELLIVIVVIAILAAITIVAYNGIQQRAHTSGQKTAASTLHKKMEAYYAINNAYPTFNSTANTITTALNSTSDSSLTGSGITLKGATLTGAQTNDSIIDLKLCAAVASLTSGTTVPTGFVVFIWDATQNPARAYATNAGGTTTISNGSVSNTGTYTCTSVS
jgi:prepilin-type N-terminal cleavage/methylation domain-containing protein